MFALNLLLFHAIGIHAAPYLLTSYVELSLQTEQAFTWSDTTLSQHVYTFTNAVTPTATDFTPLATVTTANALYPGVTNVNIIVPTGVAELVTVDTSLPHSYRTTYDYAVPVTYTPLESCVTAYSQNWTYPTYVSVYIPNIVTLPIISMATEVTMVSYYSIYELQAVTNTYAIVNPTEVNKAELSRASSVNKPTAFANCYTPTTYCPTATSATSATCIPTFFPDAAMTTAASYYYPHTYRHGPSTPFLLLVIITPVGYVLLFFLLGLLESWFSFKGLMLGKKRKRGLPYAWCCCNIVSLCWVGPTYAAKSTEDQALLGERWKALSAGAKFKIWMKWGFRWKYPVEFCGEAPPIAKRPFRQGCL